MIMTTTSLLGLLIGSAVTVQAQAIFDLVNKNRVYGLDAPIYDWTGTRLWGSDWRVEAYGGPTADSMTPLVAFGNSSERIIMSLVLPGYFQNRISSGDPVVPSVEPRGWAWLQVKAWSIYLGATYEEASSKGLGGYGTSSPFYAQGGNPYGMELAQPLLGLQSFSVLQPVPEPSTYALLLTGTGSLCWLCRRKP